MHVGNPRHQTRAARSGRLVRRLAAAAVVVGTLVGMAGPASADFTLPQGDKATITQTGLDVHGTYARLQWSANVPSTTVHVSTTAPIKVSDRWEFQGPAWSVTVQKQNGAFSYDASPLNPATKYYVILTTPATGNLVSTQKTGSFTTQARVNLVVTFDTIHVIDDGDTVGKGDLTWYFDTNFTSWTDGWYRKASSGDTFAVDPGGNGPVVMAGCCVPGSSVTVTLQGVDDDSGWISTCGFGQWTGEPKQGSNSCADFAFAQKSVALPSFFAEESPTPFTASTPGAPVMFTVSGTVQAFYA